MIRMSLEKYHTEMLIMTDIGHHHVREIVTLGWGDVGRMLTKTMLLPKYTVT